MGLILIPILKIIYFFNCKGSRHSENLEDIKITSECLSTLDGQEFINLEAVGEISKKTYLTNTNACSNEDPTQPKINQLINLKK